MRKKKSFPRKYPIYPDQDYQDQHCSYFYAYNSTDTIHMWKCKTSWNRERKKKHWVGSLLVWLYTVAVAVGKHTSKARIRRRRTRELGALLREGRMEEHFQASSLFIFFTASLTDSELGSPISPNCFLHVLHGILDYLLLAFASLTCYIAALNGKRYEILHKLENPHSQQKQPRNCVRGKGKNISWKWNFV